MTNTDISDKKPKKENLKQRAYLNSVTSILDYAARIVTGFVVTPFLVSGLGSSMFGVWQILGQFTSYTNVGDLRTTEVLKWAIAKDRDNKKGEELRQYVTATFFITILVIPLLFIIGTVITWYSPIITNVEAEYYNIVRITCMLLISAMIISKTFSTFESILRGMNLGYKRMGFRAIIFITGGVLKVIVILLGFGIIALAAIQILLSLIIGITIYIIVKRNVPWFGFGEFKLKRSLNFLKVSGWFMGWTITRLLLLNTDKVLLGYFAGPILVTKYVITSYIVISLQGVIQNVIHGVIPGIGKLYGNKEYEKLHKVREHVMLITWMFAIVVGALIIIYNESFILLWIGGGEFAGKFTNLLIMLTIIQYIFIQNDSVIINTTLEISSKVIIGLSSAIISIIISVLLIPKYEIFGLCIGLIIGRLILNIGYPILIYKKTYKSIYNINIPYRIILITIGTWGALIYYSPIINIETWSMLISQIIMLIGFLSPLIFFAGLKKRQRKELLGYIKGIELFKKD